MPIARFHPPYPAAQYSRKPAPKIQKNYYPDTHPTGHLCSFWVSVLIMGWTRTGSERKSTSRRIRTTYRTGKMAGVTGLEADPFCDCPKQFEWKYSHVHNWAHKICSQIVPDCRRLAGMRSDSLGCRLGFIQSRLQDSKMVETAKNSEVLRQLARMSINTVQGHDVPVVSMWEPFCD
jgi:hypothetical protein